MKIKDTLSTILGYLSSTRQAGHTTAMIRGAQNVDSVIVLTHTHEYGRILQKKLPNAKVTTLDQGNKLLGLRTPLMLDNALLHDICAKALDEIERLENLRNVDLKALNTLQKNLDTKTSDWRVRADKCDSDLARSKAPQTTLHISHDMQKCLEQASLTLHQCAGELAGILNGDTVLLSDMIDDADSVKTPTHGGPGIAYSNATPQPGMASNYFKTDHQRYAAAWHAAHCSVKDCAWCGCLCDEGMVICCDHCGHVHHADWLSWIRQVDDKGGCSVFCPECG